ncbi:Mitochondrial-processing peptidase subunit alpha [Phytophthora palmivora]|uniref:Mitochondrial-processing peptidase subunit alpha n=1 Tax=Phytophthora palmivora TaxID=4796 RepID=A0A2P4YMU6_9STRA|nr:Mitochondrial-processing peptidase subunit alpha [Phytophthora palmivora]
MDFVEWRILKYAFPSAKAFFCQVHAFNTQTKFDSKATVLLRFVKRGGLSPCNTSKNLETCSDGQSHS